MTDDPPISTTPGLRVEVDGPVAIVHLGPLRLLPSHAVRTMMWSPLSESTTPDIWPTSRANAASCERGGGRVRVSEAPRGKAGRAARDGTFKRSRARDEARARRRPRAIVSSAPPSAASAHLERFLHLPPAERPEVAAVLRGGAVRDLRGEVRERDHAAVDLLLVRQQLFERRVLRALRNELAVGVPPRRGAAAPLVLDQEVRGANFVGHGDARRGVRGGCRGIARTKKKKRRRELGKMKNGHVAARPPAPPPRVAPLRRAPPLPFIASSQPLSRRL